MKIVSLALLLVCTDAFVVQPLTSAKSSSLHARETGPESFAQFAAAAALSAVLLANPLPSLADGQTKDFKLPPINFSDKNRCTLNSSSMGQANAARDKLYDLRQCSLSGQNAAGFDLSGVIMSKTDVSKANFKEAYFSKAYLHGAWAI